MIRAHHVLAPLALITLAACATGCQHEVAVEDESSEGALTAHGATDLPWEVRSRQGETYLPNVFYADASENEQIMPLTVHGRHAIERLVYPTLGNPNLYVKSDPNDEMMTVLRLENGLLDGLGATMGARVEGSKYLRKLEIPASEGSGLRFFAVSRGARAKGEGAGAAQADGRTIFEMKPTLVMAHPNDDVPAPLSSRTTVRVVFDQAAMAAIPPGLYDPRMEVRKDGAIAPGPNGGAWEVQYNAVRVFERGSDEYSIINVTDTQVSHSAPGRGPETRTTFEVKTLAKLKEFVQRVNASTDPAVKNAAFVTFNGDLHNGGSPEALRPSRVAWTYNDEANAIHDTLKELDFPIFLTIGNHDGYTATGQVPKVIDSMLGSAVDWVTGSTDGSLEKTVKAASPKEWPGFDWDDYARFLAATKDKELGGRHVDVVTGRFRRVRNAQSFAKGWVPLAASKRNYVLYDGFHQWQRTYGPTYYSWQFGKNRYVNLNSYELR